MRGSVRYSLKHPDYYRALFIGIVGVTFVKLIAGP